MQEWRREQAERRRLERDRRRRQHFEGDFPSDPNGQVRTAPDDSRPTSGRPRSIAALEVLKRVPSVQKALLGEFDHPLLKELW